MRERLDKILVERGMVQSRERASSMIMEGLVRVDGMPVSKAGSMISTDAKIELKGEDIPYVSRGGLKLEAAVREFGIGIEGKTAIDVGASTGGFTDFMLQHGAIKVYAVDVGYGQFDWKLRNDPRVVLIERTNVRHMPKEAIAEDMDFAAIDVSFISLLKVMPNVREFLRAGGLAVALIKPQFEVGREGVGKGGIVRDDKLRADTVTFVKNELASIGFEVLGLMESPIKGQKGNIELLIYLRKAD